MSSDKQAVSTITIAELIPSKDVREYLLEKGRVFTDFEKATLIYNHSGMCYEEKLLKLKELMEITNDASLKKQIRERIEYDECFLRGKNKSYRASIDDCRGRFENAYVEIPHPFRNGDLVKVKYNSALEGETCIVECLRDATEKQITSEQQAVIYDYSDVSLRVAYIYDAARFGHEHVKITDVEFAIPDETNPKYSLLHCAKDLLSGKGGLSDLQFLCDEYCRTQENGR